MEVFMKLSLETQIKNVVYSIILFFGAIFYLITKKTFLRSYMAMVYMHSQTNGLSTLGLGAALNLFENIGRGSKITEFDENIIWNKHPVNIKNIQNEMKIDGYSYGHFILKNSLINKILEDEKNFKGKAIYSDGSVSEFPVPTNYKNKKIVKIDYSPDSIIGCEAVQQIAASACLLRVAEKILGAPVYLDSITCWRSFRLDADVLPSSKAAQLFHYDLDRTNWIKVFIYLNDVFEGGGPHVYIRGSHKIEKRRSKLLKRGYVRIQDDQLVSIYGASNVCKIYGSAGSVIFGNTSAFHKGEPPIHADRIILELQYVTNFFGSKPIVFKDESSKHLFLRTKLASLNRERFKNI